MADNEIKITLKSDAGETLSTLKEVNDAFEAVSGVVGKIGGLVIDAAEKIKQLQSEVKQMREDFEQAAVSIGKTSSAVALENLHLQDQIALLQGRPATNGLAIVLAEAAGRAQELTGSLRDAVIKERALLEDKSVGFLKSLFSGQEGTTDLSHEFAPDLDALAQALAQKQIAISEFNLKNEAVLQHGTDAQRRALEQQLQDLTAGYNQQLITISAAMVKRLKVIQDSLNQEKQSEINELTQEQTIVTGDGTFSTREALSQAEAQKQVNEQYRTRQAVIDSLRLSLLGLVQAEKSENINSSLRFQAAGSLQVRQTAVIAVPAQKDRIKAVQQGDKEMIADYQQSLSTMDQLTQQSANQQVTILVGSYKNNSTAILQASQQRFKRLEAQQAASLERRRQAFDRVFKGISGEFTNFVNGILSGHETLGQAWAKMVDDMASKFVSGLERQLMSFMEHKLMEVTIHANAEVAKDQASKAAHAKEDERTAYSAAKAAWESVVHTPIVGPVLAPIAAAATFAAVTAFGSAEGGQYIVPSEQLTMLHRNEMVLPAGVADRMRGVIEGGGSGGVTVVVNHSVSAVDAESFQAHLRRHANLIGKEVSRMLKKRSPVTA